MARRSTLNKRLIILALAGAVAPVFTASSARAALFYDSGVNNAGWDNSTTSDWSLISVAPSYTSRWVGGSDAVFQGTANTVAVTGTISSVNSLTFSTDGYTLSGGTLNLTGAGGNITTGNSASADTISSVIAGTVGLTKNAVGSFSTAIAPAGLTLNGSVANTFIGGITLNAGALVLSFANLTTPTNLVDPSNTLTLNGGALSIVGRANSTDNQTLGNVTVNGGNSTISSTLTTPSNTVILTVGTITRNVINATTAPLAPVGSYANPTVYLQSVFGTTTQQLKTAATNDSTGMLGDWVFYGNGTGVAYAMVNGANQVVSYTGTLATTATWGNMTSATTNYTYATSVVGGATVMLTGPATGNTLALTSTTVGSLNLNGNTLTLNGLLQAGVLSGGGISTLSGGTLQIGANKELVIANAGNINISANIINSTAGASSVTWTGLNSGFLTLSGTANAYSGGTYLNGGGTIATAVRGFEIGNASALGSGPVYVNGFLQLGVAGTGAITVSTGNTWYLNADITFTTGSALNTGTGNIILGGNRTISVGASSLTLGGVISDGSNGYGLTYTGLDPLDLAGANTYTGNTVVNGTSTTNNLVLLNSLAVQDSTVVMTVARLQFNSIVSSHNFTFGGLSGAANLSLLDSGSNGVALSVGNNNQNSTYSGNLTDGTGTPKGSLTKIGSGTLTLTGANTYRGGTFITGGTVVAGSTGSLGNGNVTVNGGTLELDPAVNIGTGNFTLTAGTLKVDLGSDPTAMLTSTGVGSTYNLAGGTIVDLGLGSGNPRNLIYGATTSLLSFSGGTIGSISLIDYDTTDFTASLTDNGHGIAELSFAAITPVPEPASLALLGLGAAVLVTRRGRPLRGRSKSV